MSALDGYTPCIFRQPPTSALVKFLDERTNLSWVGRWRDIPDGTDVAYTWWILTGIEKENVDCLFQSRTGAVVRPKATSLIRRVLWLFDNDAHLDDFRGGPLHVSLRQYITHGGNDA